MNPQEYLKHSTGIYTLLFWLSAQKTVGMKSQVLPNLIRINIHLSKMFTIGASNVKNKRNNGRKKTFFVAVKRSEGEWLKFLQFERAVIREGENNLYLVTKLVKGDGENYPDFPPFAISIQFEHKLQIEILKNMQSYLDGREYWVDDVNKANVNMHQTIFSIPLVQISENENIVSLNNLQINNYESILQHKILKTNSNHVEYQGGTYSSETHESLKHLLK